MALSENTIKENLIPLSGWSYAKHNIVKTYTLKDFEHAIRLVNQVAIIAVRLDHHPDIEINFNKVTFKLSTHSEKGVTEKDFQLAKEIEKVMAANN